MCSSWQDALSTGLSLFASASKIDDGVWTKLGLSSLAPQVEIMNKLVEGSMVQVAVQLSTLKSTMGELVGHFDFGGPNDSWDLQKFKEESEADIETVKKRFESLKEGVLADFDSNVHFEHLW